MIELNEAIDRILKHANGIRQGIGHIRNGANVTPDELWSANESLDDLFKAAMQAKELIKPDPKVSQAESFTTGHCTHKNSPKGCQLHNLQCGYPACDRKKL